MYIPNQFMDLNDDNLMYNGKSFNINNMSEVNNLYKKVMNDENKKPSFNSVLENLSKGFVSGFTTLEIGKDPTNSVDLIANSIGHLLGFVGFLPGPGLLGKIGVNTVAKHVGLKGLANFIEAAPKGLHLKSVPMLVSDKIMGSFAKFNSVSPIIQKETFSRMPVLFDTLEGAARLGIASSVGSWQKGVDGMMDSFISGATFGGFNRVLGNYIGAKGGLEFGKYQFPQEPAKAKLVDNMVKALSSSIAMGMPSTLAGDPLEIQIYEYLLNGYFGFKEMSWAKRAALKEIHELDKPFLRHQLRNPKKHIKNWDTLPEEVKVEIEDVAKFEFGKDINYRTLLSQALKETGISNNVINVQENKQFNAKSKSKINVDIENTPLVDESIQKVKNSGKTEVKGINIRTDKTSPNSLGNRLTNPNWYAEDLFDVESEYKKRKTGVLEDDMNIMHELQLKKFRQNPELIDEINTQGGLEFIKQSSHIVGVKNSRWEGKGLKSNFIKVLAKSYETVAKELGKFIEKPSFTSEMTPIVVKKDISDIIFDNSSAAGYTDRTAKNASNDATLAFAEDFKSAGEKLTYGSVVSQKKRYIPINISDNDQIVSHEKTKSPDLLVKSDKQGLKVTQGRVDKIVEQLNDINAKTLNIAGNGIRTLAGKYTQQQIDDFTYNLLKAVVEHPKLKNKIESIATGGQTGFDEAGAKAGSRLGIPSTINAPKDWKFRPLEGKGDISNEQQFKARFETNQKRPLTKILKNQKKSISEIENPQNIEGRIYEVYKSIYEKEINEGKDSDTILENATRIVRMEVHDEVEKLLNDDAFTDSDSVVQKRIIHTANEEKLAENLQEYDIKGGVYSLIDEISKDIHSKSVETVDKRIELETINSWLYDSILQHINTIDSGLPVKKGYKGVAYLKSTGEEINITESLRKGKSVQFFDNNSQQYFRAEELFVPNTENHIELLNKDIEKTFGITVNDKFKNQQNVEKLKAFLRFYKKAERKEYHIIKESEEGTSIEKKFLFSSEGNRESVHYIPSSFYAKIIPNTIDIRNFYDSNNNERPLYREKISEDELLELTEKLGDFPEFFTKEGVDYNNWDLAKILSLGYENNKFTYMGLKDKSAIVMGDSIIPLHIKPNDFNIPSSDKKKISKIINEYLSNFKEEKNIYKHERRLSRIASMMNNKKFYNKMDEIVTDIINNKEESFYLQQISEYERDNVLDKIKEYTSMEDTFGTKLVNLFNDTALGSTRFRELNEETGLVETTHAEFFDFIYDANFANIIEFKRLFNNTTYQGLYEGMKNGSILSDAYKNNKRNQLLADVSLELSTDFMKQSGFGDKFNHIILNNINASGKSHFDINEAHERYNLLSKNKQGKYEKKTIPVATDYDGATFVRPDVFEKHREYIGGDVGIGAIKGVHIEERLMHKPAFHLAEEILAKWMYENDVHYATFDDTAKQHYNQLSFDWYITNGEFIVPNSTSEAILHSSSVWESVRLSKGESQKMGTPNQNISKQIFRHIDENLPDGKAIKDEMVSDLNNEIQGDAQTIASYNELMNYFKNNPNADITSDIESLDIDKLGINNILEIITGENNSPFFKKVLSKILKEDANLESDEFIPSDEELLEAEHKLKDKKLLDKVLNIVDYDKDVLMRTNIFRKPIISALDRWITGKTYKFKSKYSLRAVLSPKSMYARYHVNHDEFVLGNRHKNSLYGEFVNKNTKRLTEVTLFEAYTNPEKYENIPIKKAIKGYHHPFLVDDIQKVIDFGRANKKEPFLYVEEEVMDVFYKGKGVYSSYGSEEGNMEIHHIEHNPLDKNYKVYISKPTGDIKGLVYRSPSDSESGVRYMTLKGFNKDGYHVYLNSRNMSELSGADTDFDTVTMFFNLKNKLLYNKLVDYFSKPENKNFFYKKIGKEEYFRPPKEDEILLSSNKKNLVRLSPMSLLNANRMAFKGVKSLGFNSNEINRFIKLFSDNNLINENNSRVITIKLPSSFLKDAEEYLNEKVNDKHSQYINFISKFVSKSKQRKDSLLSIKLTDDALHYLRDAKRDLIQLGADSSNGEEIKEAETLFSNILKRITDAVKINGIDVPTDVLREPLFNYFYKGLLEDARYKYFLHKNPLKEAFSKSYFTGLLESYLYQTEDITPPIMESLIETLHQNVKHPDANYIKLNPSNYDLLNKIFPNYMGENNLIDALDLFLSSTYKPYQKVAKLKEIGIEMSEKEVNALYKELINYSGRKVVVINTKNLNEKNELANKSLEKNLYRLLKKEEKGTLTPEEKKELDIRKDIYAILTNKKNNETLFEKANQDILDFISLVTSRKYGKNIHDIFKELKIDPKISKNIINTIQHQSQKFKDRVVDLFARKRILKDEIIRFKEWQKRKTTDRDKPVELLLSEVHDKEEEFNITEDKLNNIYRDYNENLEALKEFIANNLGEVDKAKLTNILDNHLKNYFDSLVLSTTNMQRTISEEFIKRRKMGITESFLKKGIEQSSIEEYVNSEAFHKASLKLWWSTNFHPHTFNLNVINPTVRKTFISHLGRFNKILAQYKTSPIKDKDKASPIKDKGVKINNSDDFFSFINKQLDDKEEPYLNVFKGLKDVEKAEDLLNQIKNKILRKEKTLPDKKTYNSYSPISEPKESLENRTWSPEERIIIDKLKDLLKKYPYAAPYIEILYQGYSLRHIGIPATMESATKPEILDFLKELNKLGSGQEIEAVDWFRPPTSLNKKLDRQNISSYIKYQGAVLTSEGIKKGSINVGMSYMTKLNEIQQAIDKKISSERELINLNYHAQYNLLPIFDALRPLGIHQQIYDYTIFSRMLRKEDNKDRREKLTKDVASLRKTLANYWNQEIQFLGTNNLPTMLTVKDATIVLDKELTKYFRNIKDKYITHGESKEFTNKYYFRGIIDYNRYLNDYGEALLLQDKTMLQNLPISSELLDTVIRTRRIFENNYRFKGEGGNYYYVNLSEIPNFKARVNTYYKYKKRYDNQDNLLEKKIELLNEDSYYPIRYTSIKELKKIFERQLSHIHGLYTESKDMVESMKDKKSPEYNAQRMNMVEYGQKVIQLLEQYSYHVGGVEFTDEYGFEEIRRLLNIKDDYRLQFPLSREKLLKSRAEYFGILNFDTLPTRTIEYAEEISKSNNRKLSALLLAKNIQDFQKMPEFERKLMGDDNIKAWASFMSNSARTFLGYPTIIPKELIENPHMKLKGNPYLFFTESAWLNTYKKLLASMGIEGSKSLEKMKDVERINTIIWLSKLDAKWQTATLLATPKQGIANVIGGTQNTLSLVGWEYFRKAGDLNFLSTINKNWNNMETVYKDLESEGVLEAFLVSEMNYGPRNTIANYGSFINDAVGMIKKNPNLEDETLSSLAKKHGIADDLWKKSAWFLRKSERFIRFRSFLAFYIKWREALDLDKYPLSEWNEPWLIKAASRGVEASQFLYNTASKSPAMRTYVGKVLTRFQQWALKSMELRKNLMDDAARFGYRTGTEEYERFQNLLTTDFLIAGLGSLFTMSIFSATIPPPLSYMKDLSQWLFGDPEEREKAFYGILPYPANIVKPIMPPSSRYFIDMMTLVSGDTDRFLSNNVWTWFPFGRLARDTKRSIENPALFPERMFGIPIITMSNYVTKMRKKNKGENKEEEEKSGEVIK